MPHEIDRVLRVVASNVWAIDPIKGHEILDMLALRADGRPRTAEFERPAEAANGFETIEGARGPVHVMRLMGTIVPRGSMLSDMSGAASLQRFQAGFSRAAADAQASAIVIEVDSPGGIVNQVLETAAMIHAARRADRPIIAHANTLAASAAYWIASAADEIVVSPSGEVGSIGVYTMHDNFAGYFEELGVERTLISAGPRKVEGHPFAALDDTARAQLQRSVNETYGEFVSAVARNRGVSPAQVRADPETASAHFGGGRVVKAREAVRQGMANRVATFTDTVARAQRGGASAGQRRRADAMLRRARML